MKRDSYQRKCALVTGSTRGIGQAIAMELAKEGINIAVNGRGTLDTATQTLDMCRKEGVDAHYFQADISDTASRENLVREIKERFGRIDILVNNAGVAPIERKDILETTERSFDRVIAINLKGVFFLTQIVAKWMIEQKEKFPDREFVIVNISSVSSYAVSINRPEYCISKAGISMMTKLFAIKLATWDIKVYEVRPGIILTDMTQPVKEKYDKMLKEGIFPIKRWGTPEDVGKAVVALVKGFYPYSTGDIINVDGGFHIRRL